MAFTTTQRAQIRYYLGYSDVSQGGAPNRLERAMTNITSGAETIVAGLLTQLAAVDADLVTVNGASRAGITGVDNGGVTWSASGSSARESVRSQGRMLVSRLSSTFGVEIASDVYGGVPMAGFVGRG